MTETTHVGKKISRIRELRGMKQETLAEQLGISQQAVSKIEQSETLDETTFDRVAKALGIAKEAIRSYNDDAVLSIIQHNTFHDQSAMNYQCSFNPMDKLVEAFEKNEKLYEALLKSEREKIVLLEKLLDERK